MEWPQFLSPSFQFIRVAKTADEALTLLKEKGSEVSLQFFVECKEYTSWIKEGGDILLASIYSSLTVDWWKFKLKSQEAKELALSLWPIYRLLESYLTPDIAIVIEGRTHKECSLQFGALSSYLAEWMKNEKKKVLESSLFTEKQFILLREFIYTGTIEYLYREEPDALLAFLRLASRLKIKELENFIAHTYRRYLTKENVLETIKIAENEYLQSLVEECCSFLSEQSTGIKIFPSSISGIALELHYIPEEYQPLISKLAKNTTQLKLHGDLMTDPFILQLLPLMRKLLILDLQKTTATSEEFLENFPAVSELHLSDATWVNDETFAKIMKKSTRLSRLYLCRLPQLTYASWGHGNLSRCTRLTTIDLSENYSIGDEEIDLITSSLPVLTELHFREPKITEKGLIAIGKRAKELRFLDISHASGISNEGLVLFSELAKNLETLILKECSGFDEEGIEKAFKWMPRLKKINLEGVKISPYFEKTILGRYIVD